MERRRLLTLLASTLAAGLMAVPAAALPGLSEPLEPLDEVVEPIEDTADTLVGATSTASTDAGEDDGDDGLLLTGEGELLEPLAPVTDPVEDALAPVTDPVQDLLEPAEPVVDTVGNLVDDTIGAPSAPGGGTDQGALPTPPVTGSAPAGGDTTTETAVLHDEVKTPELDTYWAGPGVSRNGSSPGRTITTDAGPDVASPQTAEPLTAPAAEQPVAADPIGNTPTSRWEAVLKVFAAFLVAATATTWQRSYAKAPIRR